MKCEDCYYNPQCIKCETCLEHCKCMENKMENKKIVHINGFQKLGLKEYRIFIDQDISTMSEYELVLKKK